MWQAIQYVGTPLALVAFIVAVVAYMYRGRLKHKVLLIQSVSESERAQIVRDAIKTYSLKDDNLTKEQKFNLVRTEIQERAKRLKIVAVTSVVIGFILAVVIIVLAITSTNREKIGNGGETATNTVIPRPTSVGTTLETQNHERGKSVAGKGNTISYTGRVRDDHTNSPIHRARVSIEEDQKVPQMQETDSEGIFHVNLSESTSEVRIVVEAAGYNPRERRISLTRTGIEDIRLQPIVATSPAPIRRPGRTSSQPRSAKSAPKRRTASGNCNSEDILVGRC